MYMLREREQHLFSLPNISAPCSTCKGLDVCDMFPHDMRVLFTPAGVFLEKHSFRLTSTPYNAIQCNAMQLSRAAETGFARAECLNSPNRINRNP